MKLICAGQCVFEAPLNVLIFSKYVIFLTFHFGHDVMFKLNPNGYYISKIDVWRPLQHPVYSRAKDVDSYQQKFNFMNGIFILRIYV